MELLKVSVLGVDCDWSLMYKQACENMLQGLTRRRCILNWVCISQLELGERLHATARLRILEVKTMHRLFFFYVYCGASPACS